MAPTENAETNPASAVDKPMGPKASGPEKRRKTICFDFDGVIAKYDGWKGVDVFGSPNWQVVQAIKALHAKGHHIIIWTTRTSTPALRSYLHRNKIPHHSVNSTSHNPPGTSAKPIFDLMIDDRAIGYRGQDSVKLLRTIDHELRRLGSVWKGNDEKEPLTSEPVKAE